MELKPDRVRPWELLSELDMGGEKYDNGMIER